MTALTPEDYDLHLVQLRESLTAFLETGEGKRGQLLREAEQILAMREEHPEVFARHENVEGLIADMLARKTQERFMPAPVEPQSSGCLLGWLFGRRRQR